MFSAENMQKVPAEVQEVQEVVEEDIPEAEQV